MSIFLPAASMALPMEWSTEDMSDWVAGVEVESSGRLVVGGGQWLWLGGRLASEQCALLAWSATAAVVARLLLSLLLIVG